MHCKYTHTSNYLSDTSPNSPTPQTFISYSSSTHARCLVNHLPSCCHSYSTYSSASTASSPSTSSSSSSSSPSSSSLYPSGRAGSGMLPGSTASDSALLWYLWTTCQLWAT
ncbi:unnamed protein product [Closterium sp. NIES-54]